MHNTSEGAPAHIEVVPAAPGEKPLLDNLLQLYAHDFSEFHEVALGPDGRFQYEPLPHYWSDPDRHPLIVKVDSNLAGFALVNRGSGISSSETVWDMAEFFVLRAYRRRGIGTAAAHHVWQRFSGPWEVRVMESNKAAHQFWQHATASFAGAPVPSTLVAKGNSHWHVFSFHSKDAS